MLEISVVYAHRWGSPNRVVKAKAKGSEKYPCNSSSQPAKHTAKASKAFERLNRFDVKRRVVVVRLTRQLSSQWQWKTLKYKFLHPVGMKMHFNCATDTKLRRCAWKRFSRWENFPLQRNLAILHSLLAWPLWKREFWLGNGPVAAKNRCTCGKRKKSDTN